MKKATALLVGVFCLGMLSSCVSPTENDHHTSIEEESNTSITRDSSTSSKASSSSSTQSSSSALNVFTGITFEDASFDYDGESHSVLVTGAPEFADVSYINNDKVDAGTYKVYAEISAPAYETLILSAQLTIRPATFEGIVFEGADFDYDGQAHSIYALGVPDFASISYVNNDKVDAGAYNVKATISASNYQTLTLNATMTINKADMSGVSFDDARFIRDGQAHSITVIGAPSGSKITYRRTNGSGSNSFTDIGVYEIEATISHKNYVTKVLNATLTIFDPAEIIGVDENKTAYVVEEPLLYRPIFDKLMEGNYTLYYHSGYYDSSAPEVKEEHLPTTYASDGVNFLADDAGESYHYYDLYTNCGVDSVNTYFRSDLADVVQTKLPSIAMNETVILRRVAAAFMGVREGDDGEIISGIDLDDFYYDVGSASLVDGRFVIYMEHPRSLSNGDTRYFYRTYEFYNIGNTKLDIPDNYFLPQEEIDDLQRMNSPIFIDGVAYTKQLVSTYNSPVKFMAHTFLEHWLQLIVAPGVHYVLPDLYGQIVERVVFYYYTEQPQAYDTVEGYELNFYFDSSYHYQGEYEDYGEVSYAGSRFVSYGGAVHFYEEWHG